MKRFLIFFVLSFPILIHGQGHVDLDKFSFNVQYRSLPQLMLEPSFRTYNVQIESARIMEPFLRDIEPDKMVLLDGWRKISEQGHITIKVRLEELLPESFSVKERVQEIKDKNGVVKSRKFFFSQEVVYTFAAFVTISDYRGVHVLDQILCNRENKQVYRSPEFPVRAMAEGYYVLNSLRITTDLYRRVVTNAMHQLTDRITRDFGYGEVNGRDFVWVIGNRRHQEYGPSRNAIRIMSDVFFTMDPNNSIENARQQLEPVISYFDNIKRRYKGGNRHDRKIRYASYYNLAVIYYYLDDPQMMMREANGLILNDFEPGDGRGFEISANRLKNQFLLTNINTRHFPIDISQFKGPYEK